MKLLVVALFSTLAFAAHAKGIEGTYSVEKPTMVWATSEDDCLADKGIWHREDEVCELTVQDSVEVKKSGQKYNLDIVTIGSNYHMCAFQESAQLIGSNKLVSKVEAEEYSPETGELKKVQCVVTATLNKKGQMNLTNNGHCQSFCGANAWLEASGLEKAKK